MHETTLSYYDKDGRRLGFAWTNTKPPYRLLGGLKDWIQDVIDQKRTEAENGRG